MNNKFSHNNQIKIVANFHQLIDTPFLGNNNALCWRRNLTGDFKEIASKLQLKENITEILSDDLLALQLSDSGNLARDIILNDLQQLSNAGASPSLNLLKNYQRDDEFDFISTDVYSFHVDQSPIATHTFLCTYYGASSQILPNHQAIQKVLIPEIREKLKELHHGNEKEFESFLKDYFFDLHYQAKANAQPISLGLGHLWRLAVKHPKQEVLPCIHRAPLENNEEYRLLLIC